MAIIPELQELINQLIEECERLTMEDIQTYDVKGLTSLTDAVIIATATHGLQLDAARRSLSLLAKQAGYMVQNRTEDYSEGWLVLDCSDLVIHVFIEEKRDLYDIDSIMNALLHSRSLPSRPVEDLDGDEDELSEQDLEEILDQLTEEETEEFIKILETEEDNNKK